MVHHRREVIGLAQAALLDRVAPEHAHAECTAVVRRLHLERAVLGVDAEAVQVRAVARHAVGQDAARETHLEVDGLLDFLEARIARRAVLHAVHLGRFLAREVARGVDRVDADVHHRAAAAHRLLQAPLIGVARVEARLTQDHLRLAELPVARPS